jgi:hypothetical protein
MPDLNTDQTQAQLVSLGLTPVDQEDLDEITHRINALRQALAALEPEELDDEEFSAFDQQASR